MAPRLFLPTAMILCKHHNRLWNLDWPCLCVWPCFQSPFITILPIVHAKEIVTLPSYCVVLWSYRIYFFFFLRCFRGTRFLPTCALSPLASSLTQEQGWEHFWGAETNTKGASVTPQPGWESVCVPYRSSARPRLHPPLAGAPGARQVTGRSGRQVIILI